MTETEALRTALEQQKQTSIELERWFRELRRSSREKLQQALSQLSESESLRRESQAKLQSALDSSRRADESLKAARDESFHAFLTGAAVGAGAAAAAYLIVTYIIPLFGLA